MQASAAAQTQQQEQRQAATSDTKKALLDKFVRRKVQKLLRACLICGVLNGTSRWCRFARVCVPATPVCTTATRSPKCST